MAKAGIKYKIHPIVMGTKVFDKSMMTYQHQAGQEFTIPIFCWYLEGGGQKILVDTGEMMPIQSAARAAAIGGPIHTFATGLAKYGLAPEDIDTIVHTHLHFDHCENDEECANAEIFVHRAELEHIHDPHPLDYRYVEDHILDVEEKGQLRILDQDTEVAPGIVMVHTPAHTAGGMTVLVDTAVGRVAITGFCVIQENFDPPKQIRALDMEVIPPGTNLGPAEAYDIMVKVKGMADRILPLHEPAFAAIDTIG